MTSSYHPADLRINWRLLGTRWTPGQARHVGPADGEGDDARAGGRAEGSNREGRAGPGCIRPRGSDVAAMTKQEPPRTSGEEMKRLSIVASNAPGIHPRR